jgi:hypothetical protein
MAPANVYAAETRSGLASTVLLVIRCRFIGLHMAMMHHPYALALLAP